MAYGAACRPQNAIRILAGDFSPDSQQQQIYRMCVIGFINTYDSQSYDTNGSHRKHNLPTQQKEIEVCQLGL
eukprot:SAG25_NODE_708_length_5832_cov_2.856794_5_plen_72_part_00